MKNETGNALFLILIAVVLFAALSYAITQSGRGGGSLQREKDILLAAGLSQALADMHHGVMRLHLLGTPLSDIMIYNEDGDSCGDYDFTFCTTGTDCLFAPEGGGVAVPRIPAEAVTALTTDLPEAPNVWIECLQDLFDQVGPGGVDRPIFFMNVTQGVCRAFNKGQGIDGIVGEDAGASMTGHEESGYCRWSGPGRYDINAFIVVQ